MSDVRFLLSGIGFSGLLYLFGLSGLAVCGGTINPRLKQLILAVIADKPQESLAGQKIGRTLVVESYTVLVLVFVVFVTPMSPEVRSLVGKGIFVGAFVVGAVFAAYHEWAVGRAIKSDRRPRQEHRI
jgi:hypothetical protein